MSTCGGRNYQPNLGYTRDTRATKAPSFYGCSSYAPLDLLEWMSDMDHYSEWQDFFEGRRVRFAKLKLVGPARRYWTNIELRLERANTEPIT